MGERDEPRPRRDRSDDPLGIGLDDDDACAGRVQRPDEPEVLVGRRDHLVAGREIEPGEHDVAAVGRRRRQRDVRGIAADECRDVGAELLTGGEDPHEPRDAPATSVAASVSSSCIASIVRAARGPTLPAWRYA